MSYMRFLLFYLLLIEHEWRILPTGFGKILSIITALFITSTVVFVVIPYTWHNGPFLSPIMRPAPSFMPKHHVHHVRTPGIRSVIKVYLSFISDRKLDGEGICHTRSGVGIFYRAKISYTSFCYPVHIYK